MTSRKHLSKHLSSGLSFSKALDRSLDRSVGQAGRVWTGSGRVLDRSGQVAPHLSSPPPTPIKGWAGRGQADGPEKTCSKAQSEYNERGVEMRCIRCGSDEHNLCLLPGEDMTTAWRLLPDEDDDDE